MSWVLWIDMYDYLQNANIVSNIAKHEIHDRTRCGLEDL